MVVCQLNEDLHNQTFRYTCPEDCLNVALHGFPKGAPKLEEEPEWDAYDGPSGWGGEAKETEVGGWGV